MIKHLYLDLDSQIMPLSLIKISIDEFNNLFEREGENIRFSLNYKNYKLKPSKKNGRPKLYYPMIDLETCIKELQMENLSLVYKKEDFIVIKRVKCGSCVFF